MSDRTLGTKKLISDLKVNELRAELEKRSLDKTGVKAILIERLDKALKSEGHDVSTYVFNGNSSNTSILDSNIENDKSLDDFDSNVTSINTEAQMSNEERINADNATTINAVATTDGLANTITIKTSDSLESISNELSFETSATNVAMETTTEPVEEATREILQQQSAADPTLKLMETTTSKANESMPPVSNEIQQTSIISTDTSPNAAKSFGNSEATPLKKEITTKTTSKIVENDLSACVWIRGISNATKATDLKTLFSKHGKVLAAKIFTTKNKLAPTCFGYISMADAASADLCIQKLNRTNLKGRVISVEKASRSLIPQINKAGKATAVVSTAGNAAKSLLSAGIKDEQKITESANASKEKSSDKSVTSALMTGENIQTSNRSESPEIIYEDVRSKNTNPSDDKCGNSAEKSNDETSTSSKKSERPRIVAHKDSSKDEKSSSTRKIHPPDSSPPKITSAARTAKNISRRVITTSNARYRNGATHTISRIRSSTTGSSMNSVRRFPAKPQGTTIRSYNTAATGRIGYRGKSLAGAASRFAMRVPLRNAGNATTVYGRSHPPHLHNNAMTGGRHVVDSHAPKISAWERNELLFTMRQREDEYRKKEEELKLQRERERLKFERERLEREKLEIQQLKLTAQLASAQMALIPNSGGTSDYNDTNSGYNKAAKSSSSKKHTDGSASDSRRDSRHESDRHHRSKSRGTSRARSRSRSPHRGNSHRGSSRGGTSNRYSNTTKPRFGSGGSSYQPSAKYSTTSGGYGSGGGFSSRGASREKPQGNSSVSHSSRYANNDSTRYARNYEHSSSSGVHLAGRNQSPVRRGVTGRSSGGGSDSYITNGVRYLDDDLRVSQYIARTDPSYAARVSGGGSAVGGNSSIGGVSADEMFGLGGTAANSGFFNSTSRLSGDNYRDSLPSTYQTTLNNGGSSGLQWNSNSGTSRSNYLGVSLDSGSNWVSEYSNEGMSASGRSGWDNNYNSSMSSGQHYAGGRYSGGATGGAYNSRRY